MKPAGRWATSAARARLSVLIFAVLLVLLVTGFLVLGLSASRTIRQANLLVVRSVAQAADLRLSATVSAFQQLIGTSEALSQFYSDRTNDPWLAKRAHDALGSFVRGDDLVHSMYLVRFADREVIHDEYRFSLDEFVDRAFVDQMLDARLVSPQWERQRLLGPLFKEGGPRWTIPVVQGYPNTRILDGQGIIVLNFDLSELASLLRNQLPVGATAITVTDPGENEVAAIGTPVQNARSRSYSFVSDLTGWRYTADFETAELGRLVSGATAIWAVYAVAMSVWALAGILLFARIVRRQQIAVSKVTSMIRRFVTDDVRRESRAHADNRSSPSDAKRVATNLDEGEALERLVKTILQQLAAARSLQSEQMRLRRRLLVEDLLLRPDLPAADHVHAGAEEAGLDPDVQSIVVVMVSLTTTLPVSTEGAVSELAVWHGAMEHLLVAALTDQSHVALGYWSGPHSIALLCLQYDTEHQLVDRIRSSLEKLQRQIQQEFSASFVAAISDSRTAWTEVPLAAREARRVLDYRHLLGPDSIATQSDLGSFRVDVHEHQLIATSELATAFLRSDEDWRDQASRLLHGIVGDIPSHAEQVAVIRHVLYAIYDGLLELSTEYRERYYELVIRAFSSSIHTMRGRELADNTAKLLARYHRAMTELDSRDRRSDVAASIAQVVRERLTDADLSLKGLASEFNTSISTVSRLFQDVEGTGFAAFVSRERMRVARQLLSGTDVDVADVCTSVGYTNYAAFARAFKREVGLSPGRFRARASAGSERH